MNSERKSNVIDITEQGLRRKFHNPLFNAIVDDLDIIFNESGVSEKEINDNWYVDSRTSENVTNKELINRFISTPRLITKSSDFVEHTKKNSGKLYLLLGKKGIGKTALILNYYYSHADVSDDNIIIYLDLRPLKSDNQYMSRLPGSMMDYIFDEIKRKNSNISQYLTIPSKIREIDKNYEHISDDSILTKHILDNKEEAMGYLFGFLMNKKYSLEILIDNLDDFSVLAVRKIIDKALHIKLQYKVRCLVALRDYWSPKKLEIDDYNICCGHLSKPDILEIIKQRISSIDISKLKPISFEIGFDFKKLIFTTKDIVNTFEQVVKEIYKVPEMHNKLYCLSNANTRNYLKNIYYFFHSPYLFSNSLFNKVLIDKLCELDDSFIRPEARSLRFFDFIENLMAIHSLCFDNESSSLHNLFFIHWGSISNLNYQNTLVQIRIMQMVTRIDKIEIEDIINILSTVGYDSELIKKALSLLLKEALIESPDGIDINDVTIITRSIKGELYITELLTMYNYVLFLTDSVPMPEEYRINVYDKFGTEEIPLNKGNLNNKISAINLFIEFVKEEEKQEQLNCPNKYNDLLNRIRDGKTIHSLLNSELKKQFLYFFKGKTVSNKTTITSVKSMTV